LWVLPKPLEDMSASITAKSARLFGFEFGSKHRYTSALTCQGKKQQALRKRGRRLFEI
jgi:hypothetical protein